MRYCLDDGESMNKTGRLFQIGNPGGPGRPKRQTEEGYLKALMGACDLDKWGQICDRAVQDALNGEPKAREWLARYLIGNPNAVAPKPLEVVVGDLLMRDRAVDAAAERLAGPVIKHHTTPGILRGDDDIREKITHQARVAILEETGSQN